MATHLFGLEAELALSATRGAKALPTPDLVANFDALARRTLVHLPSITRRMFLANGSLLYIDCGMHPEVATPECTTPWEAVCHLRAGERLVEGLAQRLRRELAAESVLVLRSNVDYQSLTTWGCHESYMGRLPVGRYADWLIPHLVSRIVFTGAGGLDPLSPGVRFSLSPRVAHIDQVVSSDSTGNRGIFHTRDEPLGRGYSRIHVLAGDNACSQRSTWLKVATTALVVALAEASPAGAKPLRLHDPLQAMKRLARDPHHRMELRSGVGTQPSMTATEIQRHLLARVEALAGGAALPPWAPQACAEWRDALDRIDAGDMGASQAFDWPLKHALFQRECARRGFTQPMVDAWSEAVERLSPYMWPQAGQGEELLPPMQVNLAQIDRLHRGSLLAEADLAIATTALRSQGLAWQDLDAFNALRSQLCAIDLRFGAMGCGIFDTLDRQGLICEHRMVGETDIAAAATTPPPASRAAVRARWVERLADRSGQFTCDWHGIRGKHAQLDLSDPLARAGKWTRLRAARPLPGDMRRAESLAGLMPEALLRTLSRF